MAYMECLGIIDDAKFQGTSFGPAEGMWIHEEETWSTV